MTGLFPDDAVIRRVGGEAILLLGGGRALLMQLAHPQVAAGGADHSGVESGPFGRPRRAPEATSALAFGPQGEAGPAGPQPWALPQRGAGPRHPPNDPPQPP